MKRTDLMRDIPAHLDEGHGIKCRASGGDTTKSQVACRHGPFQTPQKRSDIVMRGIVIENVVEEALVAAISDGGEHTEGAVIELIGGHIARKISQGPVQEVRVHARLRLFFPQPRPSSGWWQRAQRRGGRATSANSPGGRARRPRPRAAPPDRSRGGCTDCPGAPEPTGLPGSTSDMSYSSAAHR